MLTKRRMLSFGLASLAVAAVLPASAEERTFRPGTKCSFYRGTAADDNVFSRSGGNGFLHNISGAPAEVICPLTFDVDRSSLNTGSPVKGVIQWELDGQGTAGWDPTKCNLFDGNFAFPTNNNTVFAGPSGFTGIQGNLPGGWDGNVGGYSIICTVPANAGVVSYFMDMF